MISQYEKYRKGVIERHIASNGRLLQDIVLDENKNHVVSDHRNGCDKIVGGGDNPFLYGGLLMATFSIEAAQGVSNYSLDYATKLLDYFLLVEKTYETDVRFFTRRKNWWHINKELSKDEMCGLILGLHFYIKACERLKRIPDRDRAFKLLKRFATYLKHNKYKLGGAWLFEHPFSSIFQYHFGDEFKPRWFAKAIFFTSMWGLPWVYRLAVLFKQGRKFYNLAMFLHCSLMLIDTMNVSGLKTSLSGSYKYFSKGDGKGNAYLDFISWAASVSGVIGAQSVIEPEGIFTVDLPIVELKDEFNPTHNLIGECFTWEHSNYHGHVLKYWYQRAFDRLGSFERKGGKYYVESCGLGLLFVRMLLVYFGVSHPPILQEDRQYDTLPHDGAY